MLQTPRPLMFVFFVCNLYHYLSLSTRSQNVSLFFVFSVFWKRKGRPERRVVSSSFSDRVPNGESLLRFIVPPSISASLAVLSCTCLPSISPSLPLPLGTKSGRLRRGAVVPSPKQLASMLETRTVLLNVTANTDECLCYRVSSDNPFSLRVCMRVLFLPTVRMLGTTHCFFSIRFAWSLVVSQLIPLRP